MFFIQNKVAFTALFFFLSCQFAQAQQREDQYRVVEGFAVHGYDENDSEIGYEWFDTEEKALAAKASMEKLQTTTGKYYARVEITPEKRRIPLSQGEKIKPPATINPPAGAGEKVQLKKSDFEKNASSLLKGRKGRGTLGVKSVEIKFNERGQFEINGDLTGDGTWTEPGGTAISMELKKATFRGSLNGNKLFGMWFTKNPDQPLNEYMMEIELESIQQAKDPRNQAGTSRTAVKLNTSSVPTGGQTSNNPVAKKRPADSIPQSTTTPTVDSSEAQVATAVSPQDQELLTEAGAQTQLKKYGYDDTRKKTLVGNEEIPNEAVQSQPTVEQKAEEERLKNVASLKAEVQRLEQEDAIYWRDQAVFERMAQGMDQLIIQHNKRAQTSSNERAIQAEKRNLEAMKANAQVKYNALMKRRTDLDTALKTARQQLVEASDPNTQPKANTQARPSTQSKTSSKAITLPKR